MATLDPSLAAVKVVMVVETISVSVVTSWSASTVNLAILPKIPECVVGSDAVVLNDVVVSSSRLVSLLIFGFNAVRVPSATTLMMATMTNVPVQTAAP